MKHIFLFLVSSFLIHSLPAQTITELFVALPDSSVLGISKAEREKIIKYSLDNKNAENAYEDIRNYNLQYALEIIDIKNGYLKLVGAIEGKWDMCYWNLGNGAKLVVAYEEGCGPVCIVEQFDFYRFENNLFTPLSTNTIIPEIYNDFFVGNVEQQKKLLDKNDITATLLFEIPRTGKNIVARWGNENSADVYKPYALGN
ncbi:MAG: hypothetical protein CVU05_14180 [Bacteroidetes bacterium HGW-Bacteroidetes-21]|jgi:hypothetical protein|nr:MAG: hypothetical protein CVU05_14180 [Bacteroidetes bacterium HGW-Bacteroidetes-21]